MGSGIAIEIVILVAAFVGRIVYLKELHASRPMLLGVIAFYALLTALLIVFVSGLVFGTEFRAIDQVM